MARQSVKKHVDGPQKELQGVFRVEGLVGHSNSAASGNQKDVGSRARKSHKKSRTGCGQCKRRRVKCDETRDGGCLKCRSHGIGDECDFLRLQPTLGKKLVQIQAKKADVRLQKVAQPSIDFSSSSTPDSSLTVAEDQYTDSYDALPLTVLPSAASLFVSSILGDTHKFKITSALATLNHFEEFTAYTCGSPMGQRIIQSSILSLAGRWHFLLHAILGTAAAHMCYLLSVEGNALQNARNKAADAYHWGLAVKLFRQELIGGEDAPGATRENMDALLSTIMLVAVHQFILREEDGVTPNTRDDELNWQGSFVLVEDDEKRLLALEWLTIQSGFKVLLDQIRHFISDSIWMPVLEDAATNPSLSIFNESDATSDDVERILCDFCNISGESTLDDNPYYGSVQTVLHFRRLRPIRQNMFNKLIRVIGRLTHDMRRLLWRRDTAALLVLAHWLTLMAELNQWWITQRAKREVRAIVVYLISQDVDAETARRLRIVLLEAASLVGLEI
jgi:hypothetical protein